MAGPGRLTPQLLADRVAARLPSSPIVIALSGGADSAALAWAIGSSGAPARCVSVDHGLAGSDVLMTAAAAVAARIGLEHRVLAVEARSGSETDLREARLDALETEAAPGEVIVTGHTMDDQAETVLGNVLRGAGTAGLGGIPVRRGRWVRPLLDVRREETRSVATELGLPFADDPQNDDRSIRRNRLRAETIPALSGDYNPALVEALARLGGAAIADDSLLEARAADIPIRTGPDGVHVPAASLQTLPAAIATRVAVRALRSGGAPVTSDSIAAVLAGADGHRTTIGGGVDVIREGPSVVLVTAEVAPADPVGLDPDGGAVWGEWRFEPLAGRAVGRFGAAIQLDAPLLVRAPRPGDRIDLGDGSKSVPDALAEAGIPGRLRVRWPIIESGGRIVWVVGVRAVPATTGAVITLRAVRRRP